MEFLITYALFLRRELGKWPPLNGCLMELTEIANADSFTLTVWPFIYRLMQKVKM